ncbi:hypothetical protein GGU11DRAFT_812717 [Lentinula aff. detonsa]|nr:hypothetical protein GGU11DRAFT_812717 [Lentinula aff. detonsa]
MIPKGGIISNPDGEYNPELERGNKRPPDDSLPSRPACSCKRRRARYVTSNGNDVVGPGITPLVDREQSG